MAATKPNQFWTLFAVLLLTVAVIVGTIVGGLTAWSRYRPSQPIEISMPSGQALQGTIYIGGAVTNPGLYPLAATDNIEALIQVAGGTTANADLSTLELLSPKIDKGQELQKIDINRAEVWLLEALTGIGPTLAQRIADYREQNGPFRNINELTTVEGIGITTYERIKHLITVSD